MIRRLVKETLRVSKTVVRAGIGLVQGPDGPGHGVAEYEDIDALRREAAAQDLVEGFVSDGGELEAISEGTSEISAEDLRILLEIEEAEDCPQLVDVRTEQEFSEGSIEGALLIPVQTLQDELSQLDSKRAVVLFCATGMRSIDASYILKRNGFEQISSLAGGIHAWQRAGNALHTP